MKHQTTDQHPWRAEFHSGQLALTLDSPDEVLRERLGEALGCFPLFQTDPLSSEPMVQFMVLADLDSQRFMVSSVLRTDNSGLYLAGVAGFVPALKVLQHASLPDVLGRYYSSSPNLIHALKAPVSRILGLSEVLHTQGNLDRESLQLIDYIDLSARQLRELTAILLDEADVNTSTPPNSRNQSGLFSRFMRFHADEAAEAFLVHSQSSHAKGQVEAWCFERLPAAEHLFHDHAGALTVPFGLSELMQQRSEATFSIYSRNRQLVIRSFVPHPAGQAETFTV